MPTYPCDRNGAINPDKLTADLKAITSDITGFVTENGKVMVNATRALTAQEEQAARTTVTNHDPSNTPGQAAVAQRIALHDAAMADVQGAKSTALLAAIQQDIDAITSDKGIIATQIGRMAGLTGLLDIVLLRTTMTTMAQVTQRINERQERINKNQQTLFKIVSHE